MHVNPLSLLATCMGGWILINSCYSEENYSLFLSFSSLEFLSIYIMKNERKNHFSFLQEQAPCFMKELQFIIKSQKDSRCIFSEINDWSTSILPSFTKSNPLFVHTIIFSFLRLVMICNQKKMQLEPSQFCDFSVERQHAVCVQTVFLAKVPIISGWFLSLKDNFWWKDANWKGYESIILGQ